MPLTTTTSRHRYIVVDAHNRQVGPEVHTPSRALFYLSAFSAQWPDHCYEIRVTEAAA